MVGNGILQTLWDHCHMDAGVSARKRGIAGGTFDHPTFWYQRSGMFLFAQSLEWLDVPSGLMTCEAMPGSASE